MAKESKSDRVAVVLGVGPGLGASLARRFAKGYTVAINARNEKYLQSLAQEIEAASGKAIEVAGDLGDLECTGAPHDIDGTLCRTVPAKAVQGGVEQATRNKIVKPADDDAKRIRPGAQVPLDYVSHVKK